MQNNTVLLVTNIPNPYRIALFNQVSNCLKEHQLRLLVTFGASTYSRRKYKLNEEAFRFEHKILTSTTFHFGNNEHTYFIYQGLCRTIIKQKPRVVIASGFNMATFKIALLSFFMPFKMIIWSGSIAHKGRNDSMLRTFFRKCLIKRSKSFIAYGSKAGRYLSQLGASTSVIFKAINTVDTRFYEEETRKLREEKTLRPPYHICTIGYFSKRKNGTAILKVINKLRERNPDFILDIIGEGNDLENMKSYVKENQLEKHVIFHGYRQQHELPHYLADSLVFLFQTDFDIWGLVLNEAMAAGLVCLSSIHAGATEDLIIDGVNGYATNFDDIDSTVAYLELLLRHPEKAVDMGKRAWETIQQKATIEKSAEGFLNAIKKSLEQ